MKKLLQKVFSVKNEKTHKVITIFGIRIKIASIKLLKRCLKQEVPEVLKGGNTTIEYLKKYIMTFNKEIDIEISDKFHNVIWQYWAQGEEDMPDIVKVCLASVKKHNTQRKIILLTNKNLNDYVQLPDFINKKYADGKISVQHFSDIVRTYLLYKYGGTWVDATIFMSGKIPDIIENSKIFMFKDCNGNMIDRNMNLEEYKILSSVAKNVPVVCSQSFIHCTAPNNIIIGSMLNLLFTYWKNEDKAIHYLFWHYFLTVLIFHSENIREEFMEIPYIPCEKYGALQNIMFEEFDLEKFKHVLNLSSIHKLWRTCQKDKNKCTYINYLLEEYNYAIK